MKKNPILYLYGFFMYLHGHLKYFFFKSSAPTKCSVSRFFFKNKIMPFFTFRTWTIQLELDGLLLIIISWFEKKNLWNWLYFMQKPRFNKKSCFCFLNTDISTSETPILIVWIFWWKLFIFFLIKLVFFSGIQDW